MVLGVYENGLGAITTDPDVIKAECDGKVIYYRDADRNDESIEFSTSLEFLGLHGTQLVNARTAYVVLPGGAKYIGGLQASRRSGDGTEYYGNGDIQYTGEWRNDKRHGHGSYFWIDGAKYAGEWKDDERNGYGTYTVLNGDRYEGGWKNDERNGYGTEYDPDGNVIYEGEWKNDKPHGHGSFFWKDGNSYEGEWQNGKRCGYGTYTVLNGDRYEGEWKDDKPHGQGTIFYESGNSYEGGWQNGKIYGQGTMYYKNGDRYEGEWKNDKPYGQGTMYYTNGDRYNGEWKDYKKHGHGTYTVLNGDRYEGEWRNGKRHGHGTYIWLSGNIWPDGRRYEGEWKDNQLRGYCLETDDFGATFLHERNGSEEDIEPCTIVLNKNCHVGMWHGTLPVPYNHEEAMEIIKSAEESGPECVKRFCDAVRVYGPRYGSTVLSMF